MRYWTYAEIKDKVQKDLDLEQEDFVVDSELMGYCNEAIDEAESEIHTIYEDYFLTKAEIDLVTDTETYSLPTDIYANKIRGIMYKNGSEMYVLRRVRFSDMFADIMSTKEFNPEGMYRYILINQSAAAGVQLQLVPPARADVTDGLKVWYLRNANRITADTDVCDIPEFVHFVIQFIKLRVYEKEGNQNMSLAATLLMKLRNQMIATLSAMVPDGDNEIEKDLSHYEDMDY